MKVLVACEESQEVCKAFRALGHEAYSCDIQDCSGGHPEWHIKGDAIDNILFRFWQMGWLLPTPRTNADRIRAMTDEELADFIGNYTCPPSYNDSGGCERSECCEDCWLNWLKQEADND